MAGGYAHTPDGVEALAKRIKDLERRLDAIQSSTPARNTTISGGNGLTIKDGGRFTIVDPGGTVIAEFGALPQFPPRAPGQPQVGWILRRDNGEWAGYCLTNVDGGVQSWNWTDRGGNVVLADDAFSGVGLARPYIPIPVWPNSLDATAAQTTTSATYVDLWRGVFHRQHPKLRVSITHDASVSGTTGNVRVLVDGTAIGGTLTSGFTPLAATNDADITASGSHETEHTLTVQARRTAGTGTVRVLVHGLWGVQS